LKISRRVAAVGAAALLAASLAACSSSGTGAAPPSGNALSNAEQANSFQHLVFTEPLPGFPYSQIRQGLIEVEAIESLGISSTTFVFVPGIQHPVFVCPSVGVPIPVTDQLSNPVVAQWSSGSTSDSYSVAGVGVGQPDPDGIFQGDSTGTNSLCLDGAGSQFDFYNEAYDLSVTAPAFWNSSTGMIQLNGPAVYPICKVVVPDNSHGQPQDSKAYETCTAPAASDSRAKAPGAPAASSSASPSISPPAKPAVTVSASPSASPARS
jgi:hypothetical protein